LSVSAPLVVVSSLLPFLPFPLFRVLYFVVRVLSWFHKSHYTNIDFDILV
ncbi:hypothetical protein ECPA14_3857, partial [Escherichia coli PA14]